MNFLEFINTIKNSPMEEFGVIYFAADHKTCIGVKMIASGDAGAIRGISKDKVIQEAHRLGAQGMTLVHNHPRSLMPRPSEADLHTTFTIHDIAKKEGVPVLDHLIFGSGNAIFSFTKNGIEI